MRFRETRYSKVSLLLCLLAILFCACSSCLVKPWGYAKRIFRSPPRLHMGKGPNVSRPIPVVGGRFSALVPPPDGPLTISVTDAVVMGLGNNRELRVERLQPAIIATSEQEEASLFDPLLNAETQFDRERSSIDEIDLGFDAITEVSRFFPTGTTIGLSAGTDWSKTFEDAEGGSERTSSSDSADRDTSDDSDNDWESQLRLSVTQALLQGRGTDVNLATLRQARLDTFASRYELQGKAEALAAKIETLYWDHRLALGAAAINRQSLALARKLIEETRERIELGQRARSEIYSVQAEAASREQGLIGAVSQVEKTRLQLLRLLSPPSFHLWDRKLRLLSNLMVPKERLAPLKDHVRLALQMRPDLNQARLAIQRGSLEVVKTKNGLLPKLDLFVELGRTGYSRSLGGSVSDITNGAGGLDVLVGSKLEFPLLNRKAKAQYNRSVLDLTKQREALNNLIQLVEEDIHLAVVEVQRAAREIWASSATVRYQREKRDAEIEKFRLGKSSMFRVSQAERDLVDSQLSHLQSRVDLLKGIIQLYYVEGTLLARRGIKLP